MAARGRRGVAVAGEGLHDPRVGAGLEDGGGGCEAGDEGKEDCGELHGCGFLFEGWESKGVVWVGFKEMLCASA